MKKINSLSIYLLLLCTLCLSVWSCKEKEVTEAPEVAPRLYDISPNEEANMQLATNFIDAIISNKQDQIRSMVAADFMFYGPASKDSVNIDQLVVNWAVADSLRSNQNPGVLAMTSLRVNEGRFMGDWVHVWGNYSANVNNSDFVYDVPWHHAYFIENGKISLGRTWFDRLQSSMDLGVVVPAPSN